ncbi:MAG TPA: protein kinase [Pyrinomonadaceae bacterium]|jgi:serine/threonine protein kinase/ribosomal protein L40E
MRECPKCEICYGDEVQFCPQDQSQTRHTLPGTQLLAGRYFIERRLGRGAMGQVYLAKDENLGTRRVAVKTVRQDLLNSEDLQEGEAIVRFEREARSAASISHPHVVDVTDFGKTTDGVFYLVMEYVEGETLHRLLRREGTLTVKRAVNLLKQIAEGVEAAHEAGILHRDLKPANIFIMQKKSGKSEDGFIKVGDFGLAKIVNQTVTDAASDATPSSRGIIGTPEFMSPEQMQPELGVDVRADVYALGTIAYLMLGGRTPFAGDLMQLVMQKIMHTPPPLSSLRSDIPADVERAIMLALEREPAKRPANVADWIAELEKASEDVSEKKSTGKSRLVILAPVGAEVYVDDERHGTIGNSGRLILNGVPAGKHILRVSKTGEKDDDRVIEIREDGNEQVIQAQLKSMQQGSQPSSSQGSGSVGEQSSILPGIVACTRCNSRYAEGVKFCGRCGNSGFMQVSPPEAAAHSFPCPRCSAKLPPFSKFCGRCGLKMGQSSGVHTSTQPSGLVSNFPSGIPKPVEKICQRCGGAFPPNIKFCGRCGSNL